MSSSAKGAEQPERALVAVGTATYDCPVYQRLDKVPDALRAVVGTLTESGFTPVGQSPGYRLDLPLADLRMAVEEARTAAPVVVVYYTGHGVLMDDGTYYLVGKESRPADLDSSALDARALLKLLHLRDDQGIFPTDQPMVLVILDCCYSGSAATEMLEEALGGKGNPHTWVMVSAGRLEDALDGVFARAFCDALRHATAGASQEYLSLDAIAVAINKANAASGTRQVARWWAPPRTGSTGPPPFFRNKDFKLGLAGRTVDEQHWLSRVRGGPEETTAGSYLVGEAGRSLAAEHLVTWMTDPGSGGLAVVTGGPGTGKSTMLSLPVLLAQQAWREDLLGAAGPDSLIQRTAERLPVGTPLVAVHAQGLNLDQAASVVAQRLGYDAGSLGELWTKLDKRPVRGNPVVVVDAVDEADSPSPLISSLLVPLSRQPGVRVVVGTRRHVLPETVGADLTIDLDSSRYQDPQALTEYVRRLLVADQESGVITPYQETPGEGARDGTGQVAAAIARRATARQGGAESFLLARTLRAQHDITDELRPLPAADAAPVVAIHTPSGSPEAPALRLWQVARPRELQALRRQIGGQGVVSSVSMSLLADTDWESRWLEPLLECGPVTILMDLNPFTHFEHWASLGLQVQYGTVEAASEADSRIGFACICHSPAAGLSYERATFLTVCSDMQADALTVVLQRRRTGRFSRPAPVPARRPGLRRR